MKVINLNFLVLAIAVLSATAVSSHQDGTCTTCNCQFNNVELLEGLIDAKIVNGIGSTYVRWGRTSCPNVTGTELVYSGRAGGTSWSIQGGGAEKLCLPDDPDYLDGTSNISSSIPQSPHIRSGEYSYSAGPISSVYQHTVPCSVCYTATRSSVLIIPAKTRCPSAWTREYYGYLSTERQRQPEGNVLSGHFRSSFDCVDVNPESLGRDAVGEGVLFYHTVSTCDTNGLPCPPYQEGRALSCVVCTK